MLSPIVTCFLLLYSDELSKTPWPFGIYIVTILIVAYLRRSHLVESVSLVVANLGIGLTLPLVWGRLKAYQQDRILNFLDPQMDPLGAGWQVFQSKIAIGSGGIFGKGWLLLASPLKNSVVSSSTRISPSM